MIRYDEYKKRATQDLGYISTYELEGDFHKVIEYIQKEYENYSEYMTKEHKISEWNYAGGAYLDGTKEKMVKFDRIYIDCVETQDNGREFRVKGDRNLTAEELTALDVKQGKQKAEQAEREREQLKKLQEKYPNG